MKTKNTNTMNIANTNTPFNAPAEDVIALLDQRTVRYINAGDSTVTRSKERTFKIHKVEKVWTSKDNKRCIGVEALDIDDNAYEKFRTLHLAGIEVVA
jgi:hypothetical protein